MCASRTISYGTPGQAQHGIDLLAALASAPTDQGCFQSKKVESFRVADLNNAVAKFEQGPWVGQAQEFTQCVAPAARPRPGRILGSDNYFKLATRGIQFDPRTRTG